MKLSKCHFFAKEIQYLGRTLSTTGVKPLSLKAHLCSSHKIFIITLTTILVDFKVYKGS